jgi:hypothetical protein
MDVTAMSRILWVERMLLGGATTRARGSWKGSPSYLREKAS